MPSLGIVCTACGQETFVLKKPRYDGFTRVGDVFRCASCGHEFASEDEIPFREKEELAIFSQTDRLPKVDVFAQDEKGRNCRHCKHYVVNPFTQRCGLHDREIEATDSCSDFERGEETNRPTQ